MTYEVLALKYRPKVFEDLVGQETVTRTLTHAIQQNRIAHAFLFAGVVILAVVITRI
jgi:DNA polymerase-3 subunit gamma/tau